MRESSRTRETATDDLGRSFLGHGQSQGRSGHGESAETADKCSRRSAVNVESQGAEVQREHYRPIAGHAQQNCHPRAVYS